MPERVGGKVAVVTGSGSGMGRELLEMASPALQDGL
jgi:hypothetical protein